jgi:aspartate/methionine/tyrosine aminotransferase
MIVVNNPNNPFGSVMTRTQLQAVVDFAQARDIIVLCDEVYRPLFHSLPEDQEAPPSILSLGYAKTISTSSMSKAFSLAGIRVGWIATRDEGLLAAVADARHYSTISVSQLDDAVAAYALSDAVRPGLLRRNMELARANLALLEAFVAEHQGICHWTRPAAGTTAMVRFARTTPAAAAAALDGSGKDGEPVKDDDFCLALVDDAGVLVMPGRVCFGHGDDFAGYMRLGYVCATETLREALARLGPYIRKKLR